MGNYPDGVDGTHPHFNPADPPECLNRDCMATLEPDWSFCPYCGWHIEWDAYTQASDYDNITQPLSNYIYKG